MLCILCTTSLNRSGVAVDVNADVGTLRGGLDDPGPNNELVEEMRDAYVGLGRMDDVIEFVFATEADPKSDDVRATEMEDEADAKGCFNDNEYFDSRGCRGRRTSW